MSTEELLKPRWKVIADFPTYIKPVNCNVGDILTGFKVSKNDDWFISLGSDWWEKPDSYPAIFKKLEWWEERKEEDMPEYIKWGHNPRLIYKVCKYSLDSRQFTMHNPGHLFALSATLPSTKEEYEQQNKS